MKTQEKPILFSAPMIRAILSGKKTQTRRVITLKNEHGLPLHYSRIVDRPCPYGKIGDLLWVRETWLKDGDIYLYKADFGKGVISSSWEGHWKPSIHMPRKASRITLRVNAVRVERVQDISRDDAKAEGVSAVWQNPPADMRHQPRVILNPYVANFSVLWDAINEPRGYGWDANPWVWVIEFEQVQP